MTLQEMSPTARVRSVRGGWMCRSGLHLWMDRRDADCCCMPGVKRVLVPEGGANRQYVAGVPMGRAWAITCPRCGAEDDGDRFTETTVGGRLEPGSYQCPACRCAWRTDRQWDAAGMPQIKIQPGEALL